MNRSPTSRSRNRRTLSTPDSADAAIKHIGRPKGRAELLLGRGKTTRSEIEAAIGKEISGYLTKLEDEYGLIAKHQPLFEKSPRKNVRYKLNDNFLIFWFRFLHRFSYMIEAKAFAPLQDLVRRDYEQFSGRALERYFREQLIESGRFTRLDQWWDRKGENEIDLIAENEIDKTATFFEIKRNRSRYSPATLSEKIEAFKAATGRFKGYRISLQGLSLADM